MAACSAHSPLILKATTDTTPISQTKYAPHHNPVYVMEAPLPPGAKYEVLAQLEVGKIWYGSSNNVMQSLADGARSIGADAVIEVKTWHQPSGWSWAAPHGSGKAIKITEPASVDFKNLSGTWK
jgi:hypothetical protein